MFWASDGPNDILYTWDIYNGVIISQNNEEIIVKPDCPPSHTHKPSYLYLNVTASNECGSSSSSRNVQISNDGIINPLSVTIYPNPTKDVLYININSKNKNCLKENEVFLFNKYMSLVMYKKVTEDNFTLDLNKLYPGLYILKVVKAGKFYTQTIILK